MSSVAVSPSRLRDRVRRCGGCISPGSSSPSSGPLAMFHDRLGARSARGHPARALPAVRRRPPRSRRRPRLARAGSPVLLCTSTSRSAWLTAVGVAVAGASGIPAVLRVWGAWAIAAGLVQLVVGVTRRAMGGQWPMIISGGLSVRRRWVVRPRLPPRSTDAVQRGRLRHPGRRPVPRLGHPPRPRSASSPLRAPRRRTMSAVLPARHHGEGKRSSSQAERDVIRMDLRRTPSLVPVAARAPARRNSAASVSGPGHPRRCTGHTPGPRRPARPRR